MPNVKLELPITAARTLSEARQPWVANMLIRLSGMTSEAAQELRTAVEGGTISSAEAARKWRELGQ